MVRLALIFFLSTLIQTTISLNNICEYQPDIISKNNKQLKNHNIYFYIPLVPFARQPNSIIIYDDFGTVIDCLNEQDFIRQHHLNAETVIFQAIKHIVRDTYAVLYLHFDGNDLVTGDHGRLIFMDDYFNIK